MILTPLILILIQYFLQKQNIKCMCVTNEGICQFCCVIAKAFADGGHGFNTLFRGYYNP